MFNSIFRSARRFWSTRDPSSLATYNCSVYERIAERIENHSNMKNNMNYTLRHSTDDTNMNNNVNSNTSYDVRSNSSTSKLSISTMLQETLSLPDILRVYTNEDLRLGSEIEYSLFLNSYRHSLLYQISSIYTRTQNDPSNGFVDLDCSRFTRDSLYLTPTANESHYLAKHKTLLNLLSNDQNERCNYIQTSDKSSQLIFVISASDGFVSQSDTLQGSQ